MIIVNLDVMMAKRKISSNELAEKIGITPANLSVLKTNKGTEFFVGEKKGNKMDIEQLKDGKKIIISFFGSYDKLLESFGLHLMDKKEYMKVLFTGYFELKAKLKKEKFSEEINEKIKNKKFTFQEETIIRTCRLPSAPFNEVMKFCVI